MYHPAEQLAHATDSQLEQLLNAILQRYAVLFPDWELTFIPLQRSADRNEQIDRMIAMLQGMKNLSAL